MCASGRRAAAAVSASVVSHEQACIGAVFGAAFAHQYPGGDVLTLFIRRHCRQLTPGLGCAALAKPCNHLQQQPCIELPDPANPNPNPEPCFAGILPARAAQSAGRGACFPLAGPSCGARRRGAAGGGNGGATAGRGTQHPADCGAQPAGPHLRRRLRPGPPATALTTFTIKPLYHTRPCRCSYTSPTHLAASGYI